MDEHGEQREVGKAAWEGRLASFLDHSVIGPVLVLLAAIPLWLYAVVDLEPRAHIALSLLLIGVSLLVARRWPSWRLVVVILSLAASFRYILWRGQETLNWAGGFDTASSLLLYAAELYAFITLVFGYFQTAILRRRRPVALDGGPKPTVDIFIPTYNESVEILRMTIVAAKAIDYPNKTVYVLDDGRRPEMRQLARELGAVYMDRPDNEGAKAGNINAAMARTSGELIAIFDADHVPVRSFLDQTVGFFLDRSVALVQTPHHFYNPDPFERNLFLQGRVPSEQHFFYHGIQLGNDFWNSAFFCGSCAVIRRVALEQVGGIAQETVTEDAHTALKLHAEGWQSVYYDRPLAAGLATERYAWHVQQRIRWARGMAQIFRMDNPLLKPGLTLAQRLNYAAASSHFFFGLPRIMFLLAPPAYLLLDLHPLAANVREVLIYAIPHLALCWIGGATMHRNVRHSFWPEVYETAIAPYTALVTSLAVIAPGHGKFNVTTKGGLIERATYDWRNALPVLALLTLVLSAAVASPFKWLDHPMDRDTIMVAILWNVYNAWVLLASAAVALERPQRRRRARVPRRRRVLVAPADQAFPDVGVASWEGTTIDLSEGGLKLVLPGVGRLPARVQVTLIAGNGLATEVSGDVLDQRYDGTDTTARVQFDKLDPQQRGDLALHMFSDPDSWSHDRYEHDRPLDSWVAMAISPVVTFLRRPGARRKTDDDLPDAPLVPEEPDWTCAGCGAVNLSATIICQVCGASLELDSAPPPLPRPPPRRDLFSMVSPTVFVALSLLLALGYRPVVSFFSVYMPMERWEPVTFQTRLAHLGQAYDALVDLYDQLDDAVKRGEPLPVAWTEELFTARRDFALTGEVTRPECAAIEVALHAAMLNMISAEREHRSGVERQAVLNRLESVEVSLQDAERALGGPSRGS